MSEIFSMFQKRSTLSLHLIQHGCHVAAEIVVGWQMTQGYAVTRETHP